MRKIRDHRLVGVEREFYTENVGPEIKPKFIMVSGYTPFTAQYRYESEAMKESVHIVINGKGHVIQNVSLNMKAFHAGSSYWQGWSGLNSYAIGIHVEHQNDGYTQESSAALHAIVPEIVLEYNIRDIISIPRPGFVRYPVEYLKPYVEYGNAESIGRFLVSAEVAVYAGPSEHFDKMDRLLTGDTIKVLRYDSSKEWAFVLYTNKNNETKSGWTHESFLRRS